MRLLKTIDELTDEVMNELSEYANVYGEPEAFVDAIKYDDENETMISVKFTEESDGLPENEKYYKAEIIITNDNDCMDDDNVLCSNGLGRNVVKELLQNISKLNLVKE